MSTASGAAPRQSRKRIVAWIGSLFTLKNDQFRPIIGLSLSHPGTLAGNWERAAWTLAGVVNALVVELLIDRNRPPQAAGL